jgi:hypothetical protein
MGEVAGAFCGECREAFDQFNRQAHATVPSSLYNLALVKWVADRARKLVTRAR